MARLFWIGLAGAVGTRTRCLFALWAAQRFGSAFPHGTLIVNVIGCFAIASPMHAAMTLGKDPRRRQAKAVTRRGGRAESAGVRRQHVASVAGTPVTSRRFVMYLRSGFAALSLVLAAVGIAGVVGYSVVQRTPEIGVRVASGRSAATCCG